MKKLIFLLLMMSGYLEAFNESFVEFRASYFYPTSSDFRKIFGSGVNYQLGAIAPLPVEGLNLFGAVDYFAKKRSYKSIDSKARIQIIPLTLGLKYFFPKVNLCEPLNFYVGAGMKYFFLHTNNNSEFIKNTINKKGLGAVAEGGFLLHLTDCLLLDVFSSYSYKRFDAPKCVEPSVKKARLDLSNINAGVGVLYRF